MPTRWEAVLLTVFLIQCRAPYHTCILGGQSTSEQRSMSTTSPLLMTATSPPVIIAGLSLLISHYSVSFLQILISFSQVCKINRDTLCDMASPLLDVKFQSLRKRSPWVHDPSSPNFCAQCLRPWLVQSVLFWRCCDALWLPVLWIASYWQMIGHMEACRYRCSEWRYDVVVSRLTPLLRRISCVVSFMTRRIHRAWSVGVKPATRRCLVFILVSSTPNRGWLERTLGNELFYSAWYAKR